MTQRSFAYQWSQRTWRNRIDAYTGQPLPYSASEQFANSGVNPGDLLYVLAFSDGREDLLLIGRFEMAARVERLGEAAGSGPLFTRREALELLGDDVYGVPLYGTDDDRYLLPRPGSPAPMRFDRSIPRPDRLRFETPRGPRYLRYDRHGKIDVQAVRSMSRLASASARALDELLEG